MFYILYFNTFNIVLNIKIQEKIKLFMSHIYFF